MRPVAVLFAATPSVYDELEGCDVFNAARDARSFSGGMPVVAHPPCAQWGRLHHFARKDPTERGLALFAVLAVRQFGGVLEHPYPSRLWGRAGLPHPGARDRFGGFTLPVDQCWFGHRARKRTLLYIVGVEPHELPPLTFTMTGPQAVIESTGRRRPGALPADSRHERSATPRPFAEWLVTAARATRAQFERQVLEVA